MKKGLFTIVLLAVSLTIYSQKIFKAYENKDYDKVEKLLKSGENPNVLNKDGVTLLFLAASDNDIKTIKLLDKYNVNIDLPTGEGKITPFFMACASNSYEAAEYLLQKGADVNYKVKAAGNQTPIRFACKSGSIKLVKLLLENKAELHNCPDDCITPLIQAARSNHIELVKFLIEKGAEVNHQARDKECALNQAIKNNNEELVRYLISKGAESMTDVDGLTSYDLAIKAKNKNILKLIPNK